MGAEMNEREALKLALEALDCICSPLHVREIEKIGNAMKAIREALAQPEFMLNGVDCSCGRKWRVVNNTLTASEQPEQESDDLTIAYMAGFYDGKNKDAPQPKQEPEAMRFDFDGYGYLYIDNGSGSNWKEKIKNAEPLYTTSPQRKPLTDEQIDEIYFKSSLEVNSRCEDIYDFVRAIEAAHGIKE